MMKLNIIAALCLLAQASAFVPHQSATRARLPQNHCVGMSSPDGQEEHSLVSVLSEKRGIWGSSVVGLVTGLCGYVSKGMASSDELEIAELPPPYVPALFGVVLLAGVGLLTASLGNVMDEGMFIGFSCICQTYDPFFLSRY
jgi:hypothetical protein